MTVTTMTREQMELWAQQNLHTLPDYYEAFVGLQDAVDRSIMEGTAEAPGGYGAYVFRHTAKALKKVAKQRDLRPQDNPPRKKRGSARKKTKRNPKKVSVGRLVSNALK